VIIGYVSASIDEENTSQQRAVLERAGVLHIFEDDDAGITGDRPGLDAALKALHSGDTLVVWKLDQLGRSLSHLIALVQSLGDRGIAFQSVSENIDTSTTGGNLVFHVMGALAQFERSLLARKTKAGMAAARSRGSSLGRNPSLTPSKVEHARMLIENGKSVSDTARTLNVGRSTLYRALRADGAPA